MLRLIGGGTVDTEVRLQGSTVDLGSLLGISEGMVLQFDHPADRPLDVLLNGKSKFRGHLFGTGTKRTFQIEA